MAFTHLHVHTVYSLLDGFAKIPDLVSEAKKLGFKYAIAPATIKDKFVIPAKDLRETLIKYVNKK